MSSKDDLLIYIALGSTDDRRLPDVLHRARWSTAQPRPNGAHGNIRVIYDTLLAVGTLIRDRFESPADMLVQAPWPQLCVNVNSVCVPRTSLQF